MANYTLRVTQNGQTKTAVLRDNQNGRIAAESNTDYQLYNEQGELITHPVTERVDDDLLIFADGNKDGSPEFVLVDYFNKNPILNADYVADAGNSLMTNDKLAAVVPVAESGAWVKAATVVAAAAIGGAIWAVTKDDDNGNPDWRVNDNNQYGTNTNNTNNTNNSTNSQPSITINKINDIQKSAVADEYTISGSLNNLNAGDTAVVWVSVNGNEAQKATVNGDKWTLTAKGSELAANDSNTVVATLSVTDKNGQVVTPAQSMAQTSYNVVDKIVDNGTTDNTNQPSDNVDDAINSNDPLNPPSITVNHIDTVTTKEGNTTITGSLNLNNDNLKSAIVWVQIANGGGEDLQATISADKKSWSIDVPNSRLAHAEGEIGIKARVDIERGTQKASADNHENTTNPISDTNQTNVYKYAVDATVDTPSIVIDDVKNIEEANVAQNYTLSGSINHIDSNAKTVTVTVNVNGADKTATVDLTKKTWTVEVAGKDLAAKVGTDLKVTATVEVEDSLGRKASASDEDVYDVIAKPVALLDKPEITVHTIPAITKEDLAKNGTTQISGSLNLKNEGVALDSETVTVKIGDKEYPATISTDKKSWTLDVPTKDLAANQGEPTILAEVVITKAGTLPQTADNSDSPLVADAKDANNNVVTFTVDTELTTPTIKINALPDFTQGQVPSTYKISGTLDNIDKDVNVAVVTLDVNGKKVDADVNLLNKTWSANVSGSDLASTVGENLKVAATVTVKDDVNTATSEKVEDTYNMIAAPVTPLEKPEIRIHNIDKITTAEGTTKITGSLNLKNEGVKLDRVSVTLGLKNDEDNLTYYVGDEVVISADQKSWSVNIPNSSVIRADGTQLNNGKVELVAGVTIYRSQESATSNAADQPTVTDKNDPANNNGTITIDRDITTPSITIKDVADIDQASVADKYTLSGSLNNIDADVTSTVVTVNVNGTDKIATVSNDKKSWTLEVTGNELANKVGADLKVTATVKVTDAVGNTATSSANDTYNVTAKPVTPSITIDTIASDEVALMNKFFGTQNKTISGKLADIPTGATPKVEVTVAGKAYTATVSGSTWSIAVPKSELTERGAKDVVAKLTVNGASDEATATFYVIDPNITIDQQSIHITQDNLNGTTTLTGTYDVEGADTRKVLVQIGIGSKSGLSTVAKEYSSDDTTNPVVLNEDNNTWSITVSNKDLAFQVGDVNTLQVGAKIEFTEGSQGSDKYTGLGYASDVVAPKASPLVLDLVDEEMPVTSYVLSKTTEVGGDDSVSGNDDVADTFVFSQVLDGGIATIANFDVNEDRVQLSSEVFTALSNTMSDFADYVQYDAATGALSYDADGTGAGVAVQFAQLDKDLPIEQNHFIIG